MSGVFPSTPKPTSVAMSSVSPTMRDESQSGYRNVRQFGVQKWRLELSFPNTLSRDQFMPVMAFLMSQQGRFETFTYTPPDLATPRGTGNGTPVVAGASQTGRSIATSGWPTTGETVLKAGDVVRFVGNTKVYMVTSDVVPDGTGAATINLNTPVIASPANLESIDVSGVEFTVELAKDSTDYTVSGPTLYNFSVNFIEAI